MMDKNNNKEEHLNRRSSIMRLYSDMRFKQLTLLLAWYTIAGFGIVQYDDKPFIDFFSAPFSVKAVVSLASILFTAVVWIMEYSATLFWDKMQREDPNIGPAPDRRFLRVVNASTSVFVLYAIMYVFWCWSSIQWWPKSLSSLTWILWIFFVVGVIFFLYGGFTYYSARHGNQFAKLSCRAAKFLRRVKTFFRRSGKGSESNRDMSFNPLSWGILFFTLWLIVQALNTLPDSQKNFSWFLFALSIVALVSIPWSWLRKLLNTQRASQIILPVVFELTVAGYIIGWVGMLKDVHGAVLGLAVAMGFMWLIVYIMVAAAKIVKPYLRVLICAIFFGVWVYYFAKSGLSGSWPLIIVMVAVFWASIKPQQFRWIPLT